MAIPAFENGFLPVGSFAGPADDGGDTYLGWETSLNEIHGRLVAMFADSTTRPALYEHMTQMLTWLGKLVPCALVYVSGSFVTDETDPVDLHLAVIVMPSALSGLDPDDHWLLNTLLDEREDRFANDLRMTTSLAQVYGPEHPRHLDTLDALASIRYVCANPLEDGRRGGYVQFTQCEGGGTDAEILDLLAGATAPS